MKIPPEQRSPYDTNFASQTIAPRGNPVANEAHRYLTARQTRNRYGDISDMSLWRWLRDESLHFPKPVLINGRRYWRLSDLVAFEKSREAS